MTPMEKTGIPRPELDPVPEKQAGDQETRFPGDNSITEKVLQGAEKKSTP